MATSEAQKAADARYRDKNRERIRAKAKEYRLGPGKAVLRVKDLKVRYGLSPDEYDELLASQSGKCAICARTVAENRQRLGVDHCHGTGRVRGLLCYRCNTGLGNFSDSPSLLRKALSHLGDNSHDELVTAGNAVLDYATLAEILADSARPDASVFGIRLGDLRKLSAALASQTGSRA